MVIRIGCCHIGICYPEGDLHLRGCHNDVIHIQSFLSKLYSAFDINYYILIDTDDRLCGTSDNIHYNTPTKDNIQTTLLNMIDKFEYIIITYSGHGSNVIDWNGDEQDGRDEAICPIDFKDNGFILDDWFKHDFLKKLNKQVKVRILMDCCHSGTIMDLKYKYDIRYPTIFSTNLPALDCDVQCLSGCGDEQSSFDVYTTFKFQGAFTHCFLKTFNAQLNTKRLCSNINNELEKGGWGGEHGQISKYTSSRSITNTDVFLLYVTDNVQVSTDIILNQNDIHNPSFDLFMNVCSIG